MGTAYRWPYALPLTLTLAVRCAVLAMLPSPPVWDGVLYARYAMHLAAGDGFIAEPMGAHGVHGMPGPPTAFYPVGYPAVLSMALAALGSVSRAVALVNLTAALCACAAVVAIGTRLGDRSTGLRAGVFYALAPGAALWCAATMTETLHGALCALACATTLVPHRHRTAWTGVTGVLVALATLVRPQALVLAPVLGALAVRESLRARVLRAASVTAVALALVAPWTLRNCTAVGGCALVSTNGGSNLLIGTFPEVHGGYRAPGVTDGCALVRSEAGRDRCMRALALDRIRAHPARWLLGTAEKLGRTVGWEHDPVTYLRRTHPVFLHAVPYTLAVGVCTVAWWLLMALALRGVRRGPVGVVVPALATLALLATHAVFLGADRYHLAVLPLVCALAAAGVGRPPVRTA